MMFARKFSDTENLVHQHPEVMLFIIINGNENNAVFGK